MKQVAAKGTAWDRVKSDLSSMFDNDTYHAWFENVECLEEAEGALTLTVPNDFAAIWIEDNYADLISARIEQKTGRKLRLEFQVTGDNADVDHTGTSSRVRIESESPPISDPTEDDGRARIRGKDTGKIKDRYLVNPRNTFGNFVVGPGSQMAHACAVAVANAPARTYNPLFIYGDTGLGKTHLMHAVAIAIMERNPEAHVAYVPSEKFTNKFIHAIQDGSLVKFRRRYRRADVLLIDDIHFLSGKERSQEEIFHTFNELYESQKQIIIASDRPANEIARLENRLVSRFGWGMVADIQPPDLETRQAILEKKARAMNLELDESIIHFLAKRVPRNVRRMEGALTRVGTYATMTKSILDIDAVEHLLQDILQEEAQQQVTVEKIQKRVADHYQIALADMSSKRRPANIAFPRQVAMYLSRILTSQSLQEIGDKFGGRDHGTVIHAMKTVENMMDQDENIRRTVDYLKKNLADHV